MSATTTTQLQILITVWSRFSKLLRVSQVGSARSATASATAAAAVATRPATAGSSHYVAGVRGSYGAAQIGTLTLEEGATVIGTYHVHNQRDVVFERPMKIASGTAVTARLTAGAAGVVGAVDLETYTLPDTEAA